MVTAKVSFVLSRPREGVFPSSPLCVLIREHGADAGAGEGAGLLPAQWRPHGAQGSKPQVAASVLRHAGRPGVLFLLVFFAFSSCHFIQEIRAMQSYLFYKCERIFCVLWYLKHPSASLCLFTLLSPSNTAWLGQEPGIHAVHSLWKKEC